MSTIVYRYSDKYKPNKTKGYRFRVRRDGYARDLKTLDKKPPIINDINKTDIKKIKRRRKVPGWSKTGSVISKRFVWSGKESASRVLSDLSHMGLNSDYRSDIELTLNHYLCNYMYNFRDNGYLKTFEEWLNDNSLDDLQTVLTDKVLCKYSEEHIYNGIGVPGRFCVGMHGNSDIGISLWIK